MPRIQCLFSFKFEQGTQCSVGSYGGNRVALSLAVAGPCFGTAVAFAKLGVNVAVQGAVGRDGMAYFMVHDMKGFSIDVSNIKCVSSSILGHSSEIVLLELPFLYIIQLP
jgi:sugar/nucleoside kinase (ribokinase family)